MKLPPLKRFRVSTVTPHQSLLDRGQGKGVGGENFKDFFLKDHNPTSQKILSFLSAKTRQLFFKTEKKTVHLTKICNRICRWTQKNKVQTTPAKLCLPALTELWLEKKKKKVLAFFKVLLVVLWRPPCPPHTFSSLVKTS